ncbi:hypothetical protein FHG87_005182 [Trinorchestia longiramus]|nr:hypothetical protein FHG87_005182 [Trinorchestia longiramus]
MTRWYTVDPVKVCGEQHSNITIAYHECLCQFNYASHKRKMGILKFKHCALADEMRKQMDFDMYKIIGFSIVVFVVVAIVLFCSFKWYQQTKKNPCVGCCSCFSCLCGKKKKRRPGENGHCNGSAGYDTHDSSAGFDEHWAQGMNSDVGSLHHNGQAGAVDDVPTLQRRPTRPAPPPPKLPGAPGSACHNVPVFEDGSLIVDDDIVCDPIPEAPPSPEPVRQQQADQPRSIYVDPLAFLQKPFLRLSIALSGKDSNPRDSRAEGKDEDEPDALYSRVKDFVMSKVRKSSSIVSLNRASGGVSSNPDGGRESPTKGKNKYGKTASMASLHDITETDLDKSYDGNKRSMSLASLTTVNAQHMNGGSKSRHGSRYNLADEDVSPNQRDEYIDLEEMARKMAARMQQQQQQKSQEIQQQPLQQQNPQAIQQQQQQQYQQQQQQQYQQQQQQQQYQQQQQHQQQQQYQQQQQHHELQQFVQNPQQHHQQDQQALSQLHRSSDHVNNATPVITSQPLSVQALQQQLHPVSSAHNTSTASVPQMSPMRGKTPDFIPASAYGAKSSNDADMNRTANYEIGPSVLYPNSSHPNVATVSSNSTHPPQSLPSASPGSAFSQSNFSNVQTEPHNTSAVTALVDATGAVPLSIVKSSNASPQTHTSMSEISSVALGALVPYSGNRQEPHSSVSSVSSTPAGTLKRQKPSVPPRPAALSDNSSYKSLGRPTVVPPSPKLLDPRRNAAGPYGKLAASGTMPRSPMMPSKPGVVGPIPSLSLHEQQILQQQLIQQQQLQQFYLQQNPHLNPAYQQLLLQQQLLQEHTIMTPSVQQQVLQEQQLYQQMLQQQQQHFQLQQYQQQLLQQQLQQGMRYRQPLSSASSTGSSCSSKSLRSVHKPSHPPPPPPSSGGSGASFIRASVP